MQTDHGIHLNVGHLLTASLSFYGSQLYSLLHQFIQSVLIKYAAEWSMYYLSPGMHELPKVAKECPTSVACRKHLLSNS